MYSLRETMKIQIMEAQITSEAYIKENIHIPISDAIRQLFKASRMRD